MVEVCCETALLSSNHIVSRSSIHSVLAYCTGKTSDVKKLVEKYRSAQRRYYTGIVDDKSSGNGTTSDSDAYRQCIHVHVAWNYT